MSKRILFTAGAGVVLIWLIRLAPAQQSAVRTQRPGEPPHYRQSEVGWRYAVSWAIRTEVRRDFGDGILRVVR